MRMRLPLFERDVLRLMGLTIATKAVSLFTQVLIASYFGAGAQLDAYAFALFPVRAIGDTLSRTFSSVGIPQITRLKNTHDPNEVHRYQNAMILLFGIPVFLVMIVFLAWGQQFIDLFGFQLPAPTKFYASRMIRILAVPGFILFSVGVFSGILNLNRRFQVPALMQPLNAMVTLACIVFLHTHIGIWSLPAGFCVSYLLQAPLVIARAGKIKAFALVRPAIRQSDISTLWNLSWLILASQVLLVVNSFVDKWFASGLEAGSISSINYSMTLMNFGQQVFSMSLIVVMFTKMSEFLTKGQIGRCSSYIESNLRKTAYLVVPVSLALFIVSPEIVRVLFQRGAFDQADTQRTSGALSMYLVGLPALVVNGIITKIFQSLQKLREKAFLALQYILTNIIGNMILVKTLATTGLAISSSVAINLHLVLSLVVLYFYGTGLRVGRFIMILGTTYLMAFIAWLIYIHADLGPLLEGLISNDTRMGACLLGCLKFLVVVTLFGIQALAVELFRRRASR